MNLRLSLLPLLALASLSASASRLPALPKRHLPVPLVPQSTAYSCGAAALMAVLEYWNVYESPESELFGPLNTTPKDGTSETRIAQVAHDQFKLDADVRQNLTIQDLNVALGEGTTVIVDLQAWAETPPPVDYRDRWDDGHYVVLVALDKVNAYFMDPSAHGAYAYLTHAELLDRWHDSNASARFFNLAIFIRGKEPRPMFPGELVHIR